MAQLGVGECGMTGTQDSDYREQIAEVLHAAAVDVPGTPQVGPALIERQIAALWPRVSPLVEQLRQARAAYNRMAGHAVDRAAERDRYYLAWQSAARGRRQARVERDTARNQFLDHYNGTAGQLDRIRELQDALRERTGQRDEARAERELARESRDQYHKNWDAAVAANMTALDTIGGLRADLETRTCERDYARAELAAVGRAIECYLGVEYGTPVESARALVERCADAESALDGLRTTAVVLPEDWERRLGDCPSSGAGVDLVASWRAAPVEAARCTACGASSAGVPGGCGDLGCGMPKVAGPVEAETPAPLADLPPEEWRAFHEAATGVDPGPETPAPTDRKLTENLCVACRQMYAWYGDEALSLIPADHVHAPAVKGVDWKPGCSNPDCESCRRAGRPCDEHMGEADDFCPRCGWHEGHHLPVASPGTGTEAGE